MKVSAIEKKEESRGRSEDIVACYPSNSAVIYDKKESPQANIGLNADRIHSFETIISISGG